MRNYHNELAFSKHLCEHLTRCGYFVQRIETRETGRGVPDLYVGAPSGQYWIELKRIKGCFIYNMDRVPWRSGQQRWMYRHFQVTKIPCFTFIAFDKQIVCVAHKKMYSGDRIRPEDILQTWVRVEDVRL